ncbi:hypothetical protein SAMN04488024_101661 [Pedobacter soli]|uniref:Uncharacterized protein n=1 Tax=Pedobacter soli TaxID=390242 RepID=A0A1G6K684_9SPHI|nr:hypothetical protein SAMN04488024_101661 [Pedobacter soli]
MHQQPDLPEATSAKTFENHQDLEHSIFRTAPNLQAHTDSIPYKQRPGEAGRAQQRAGQTSEDH